MESDKDIKRFESYLNKTDSCWLWKGGKDIKGYGIFFYKGRTTFAHRVSLLLYNKVKELTPGLVVRHSCRNTSCVNPNHLSEGTKIQNSQDKDRDGTSLKGERCHFSKLNWEIAEEIRSSNDTRKNLAVIYDVSVSCITSLINNKSWVV